MPNEKKIHVADLRVGMYVSKLDREWLDTPFLMQGFIIEDPKDVDVVAEYCEYVWIDDAPFKKFSRGPSSNVGTATYARIHPVDYRTDVIEEQKRVFKTFRKARSLTKNLLDDIRLGGAIDTEGAKDTVKECVHSILNHPDALLWMSKIRQEREYTAEHSMNVCILAIAFGRHLGMSESDLHDIGLCGLLHDIGKMRVPIEILDKPGRLTDKEMKVMKAHTVHGRNLLLSNKTLYTGTIDVAYSHHERVDGTGYPRKLPAAGISRYSRIVAIVDAYDAMTADRCYSKAKSSSEALRIIYNDRGKHFDEELALQFIKTIGLFPPGSIVELYNGEVGIVLETNQNLRHLPKIILLLDKNKKPREKEKIIDLAYVENGNLGKDFLVRRTLPDGSHGVSLRNYLEKGLVLKQNFHSDSPPLSP